MITQISAFIDHELEDDELKAVLSDVCDILSRRGLGTEDLDESVQTIMTAKLYDVSDQQAFDFLESVLDDNKIIVIPMTPKTKENNDRSS